MKYSKKIKSAFLLAIIFFCFTGTSFAQKGSTNVPWQSDQTIQPSELAKKINSGDAKNILIINAGSVNDIQGAVNIGPAGDKENQRKLSKYLKDVPKNKSIVIYCGCCPMNHCPNIRPAYQILKEKGFTNFKILDIKENIAIDWISKGYPVEKGN